VSGAKQAARLAVDDNFHRTDTAQVWWGLSCLRAVHCINRSDSAGQVQVAPRRCATAAAVTANDEHVSAEPV